MSLRLSPYLVMDGNAREAIQFYQQALDAQLVMSNSFGEMPENPEFPLPAEARDRIGYALLKVGETDLMLSDTFPGQPVPSGKQVTICISTNDKEKAEKIFEALQQGGQVNVPLQQTFFSPAYGSVTDKYGVTFQIFTESLQ
ncbi:VOC family protein [Paenibacillus sp. J2TS4]|uniref:VOC family protein n=1 Tax=Paenibacillus sp. J2TS4 TaxID=2807194 RepID=UPI001B28448E|nr:VOC family protein [Paenibacillus sp. J2TS4]GIP34896.1 VOC family protein [Paenibacillus sp. J2TS4]